MLVLCIVCLVLCFENYEAKFAGRGCAASDTNLLLRKQTICASIGGCAAGNVTAEGDWPNQAIYMNNLLAALVAPTTCLNTSVAKDVVTWLDVTNTTTPWWNTWVIFQVQYYDMPRKPGSRIESPATLGRKCWAFAYLAQIWPQLKPKIATALPGTGFNLDGFVKAYDSAVPLTMGLCEQVMANCFVNASYDPGKRNGTCAGAVGEFYVGFQWENGASVKSHDALTAQYLVDDKALYHLDDDSATTARNDSVIYPFPVYKQTAAFRKETTFAVNTALNFII